jgi:hypothetical protein
MKITLDLPEIEGYEYTGEYRAAKASEWFLDGTNKPYQYPTNNHASRIPFPILKKKAPKYAILKGAAFEKEYVEIKALRDAIYLIPTLIPTSEAQRKLSELLKLLN